jgi:hypothetical protein
MPEKLTAEKATECETFVATVELDGTEYEIEVRDVTLGELDDLEQREEKGDLSEFEFLRILLDDYLVTPDIDSSEAPRRKVELLTDAMFRAWGGEGSELDEAMEELETPDEGN